MSNCDGTCPGNELGDCYGTDWHAKDIRARLQEEMQLVREVEKKEYNQVIVDMRARFNEKLLKLEERIRELEDAIKVSHETGMWGPVEDAYAAGGHPCLKHRFSQDDRRCPAHESGGVQCELLAGHDGNHACPEALARHQGLSRTENTTQIEVTDDDIPY